MAWNLTSRLLDFIDHSTPWVSADFLNQIQDAILWLFGGTKTLKSLKVDGTGGQPSDASPGNAHVTGNAQVDGLLTVHGDMSTAGSLSAMGTATALGEVGGSDLLLTATRSSSTPGSGQGVSLGQIYKDTAAVAWAVVESTGTLYRGANILSCQRVAQGQYLVTLCNGAPNVLCPVAGVDTNNCLSHITAWSEVGENNAVHVTTLDSNNAAIDLNFALVVFGG